MPSGDKKGNVREAALDILIKIDKNQAYSNLLINDTINKLRVPDIDVPLLTELVYGTLQHQRKLDYFISAFSAKKIDKLDRWVLILLRLSVYQLEYLDRVPDHAVINEAVEIAKQKGHKGIAGLVNGLLRSVVRKGVPSLQSIQDEEERLAVETSHPDWMIKKWIAQYGFKKAAEIAEANLAYPSNAVRVNTYLTERSVIMEKLKEEGFEVDESPLLDESIRYKKGSVIKTDAYRNGLISVQDEGSMLVTQVLDPREGEKILDSCAAPGGKSTHIGERMNNNGELISVDIHSHKVNLIEEQQKRLKLSIIKGLTGDARKLSEQFEPATFDKILVDAPCSGLGVIQRKPDLKWSKKEDSSKRLSSIQMETLNSVWSLLKPGGLLVYSTCTVDKEENDEVIDTFTDEHEDAEFDMAMHARLPEVIRKNKEHTPGKIQLFPGEFQTDGFFIAAVSKKWATDD